MYPEVVDSIKSEGSIVDAMEKLRSYDAPADALFINAITLATKDMNPGYDVAVKIVAGCLWKEVKNIERKRQPKRGFGKWLKRFILGAKG